MDELDSEGLPARKQASGSGRSSKLGALEKRLPPVPQGSARELVRNPLSFFTSIPPQYGDIVCYRPAPDTAYLLNHPDYVRHVLVENNRNYNKSTYSNQNFKKVIGDSLLTAEAVQPPLR